MSTEALVLVDRPVERVVRVTLNRPEKRNAQNTRLLFALDDALGAAARDDTISVIVLRAAGPDFSAGHDLAETEQASVFAERRTAWSAGAGGAAERVQAHAPQGYLGLSDRLWNLIN